MKIILACAGGMSSGFVADALKKEIEKDGIADVVVEAMSDSKIKEEINKKAWDIVLLAPQVKFQSEKIKALCGEKNIPVYDIEGTSYTMMGAPKIYQDIKEILSK